MYWVTASLVLASGNAFLGRHAVPRTARSAVIRMATTTAPDVALATVPHFLHLSCLFGVYLISGILYQAARDARGLAIDAISAVRNPPSNLQL